MAEIEKRPCVKEQKTTTKTIKKNPNKPLILAVCTIDKLH